MEEQSTPVTTTIRRRVFQPFGPTEDLPEPISRTLWTSIFEGLLTMVFLTWTSGVVLTGYMLYLGATPFQLAMIGSIPLLAQASAPFSAWLVGVFPHPRYLTTLLATVGRTVWLIPALLPLFAFPKEHLPAIILLLVAFSYTFQAAAGTIWSAWIGDVIPADRRGRYLGFRNGLLSVVGLCSSVVAGLFLDVVPEPLNYVLILFGAVGMAVGGIYLYTRHYQPPVVSIRMGVGDIFRIPLADGNFRLFLRFLCYWWFSVMLAAVFVFPYFLDHLELSYSAVAAYTAIAAVATLLLAPLWGRVADRVGNKSILAITTFIAGSALPLTWLLAAPGDPTFVFVAAFIDGLCWSAIGPAVFNLSLATAPQQTRVAYLALIGLFTGLAGFLGGLMAAPMLNLFRATTEFQFGTMEWTGYHSLFLFSALLRMQAWMLIRPVAESHAWRTRDVIRAARSFRFIGFFWR